VQPHNATLICELAKSRLTSANAITTTYVESKSPRALLRLRIVCSEDLKSVNLPHRRPRHPRMLRMRAAPNSLGITAYASGAGSCPSDQQIPSCLREKRGVLACCTTARPTDRASCTRKLRSAASQVPAQHSRSVCREKRSQLLSASCKPDSCGDGKHRPVQAAALPNPTFSLPASRMLLDAGLVAK
jgi:hypothetical protein